jgi:hypothetical protein
VTQNDGTVFPFQLKPETFPGILSFRCVLVGLLCFFSLAAAAQHNKHNSSLRQFFVREKCSLAILACSSFLQWC